MFVLGGPVKGGMVYGEWTGLKPGQLSQTRDRAMTTDYGDVFAEVVVRHLVAENTSAIFPDFAVSAARFRGLIA